MSQSLDIFSLSASDFNAYLQEAAQYSAPSQIDFLRREYRKRNTLSGLLDTSGEAGLEGKNVSSMLPIAGPAGMSLLDAARSGKLQTRFKDYITDAIGALVGGVENPGLAAKGLLTDDEMLGASMQTAGTAMLGGGAAAGKGLLELDPTVTRVFAGPSAKTANVQKLQQAVALKREGVTEGEILQATGWSQGPDGQWRFEISDDKAKFIAGPNRTPDYKLNRAAGLSDVIKHDELFEAYPDLKNVLTTTETQNQPQGSYARPQKRVYSDFVEEEQIGAKASDPETLTDVLLHEIDHAVQFRENFPSGSSGSSAMSDILAEQNAYLKFLSDAIDKRQSQLGIIGYRAKSNDPLLNELYDKYDAKVGRSPSDNDVNERYMRSAGEVSARNVETRRNMSAQERIDTPPSSTEDIPRSEQYFNYGSKNNYANASKGAGLLAVLPEPRNQAEANAKAILELRAQGRANEVTNDMMAAADPQYMFNNTPLDMSENARMARASELGFDSDGLHGTRGGSERSDFQSFRSDVETYIAPNTSAGAELMAQFNTVDGGKSMPLKHRGNLLDTSDRSNNFQQRRDAQEMFNNADLGKFETGDYSGLPEWSNFNAINSARDSGYDGIKLEERDWVNSTAVFNPANIRSRFARFDPEFSDLSNLSAANANASVGALVLSQHARAKPALADILAQNGVDPANINAAPIQRVQAALETATQRQILDPRSANSILQGFAQPELEDFYANANPLAGLLAIQQPQQSENRGLLQ